MSWWQQAVFYEIYLPSFKDSNGDGIGDLNGVTEKIDYLKELGVGGIWLTPFYPSPKVDNGYDISDYYAIDPIYGSFSDFERLIEAAHKSNIKIIVDLVINHTSDQHPWFQEACSSLDNPKREWYIWRKKPNNWESFFGGSAWTLDEASQEFYYHSFSQEQVDLNWSNPQVKQEILAVIGFWIEKGIDGFRLDVINNLTVDNSFRDNPFDENGEQIHQYDVNQVGIINTIKEIKAYISAKNKELFTVGEISSDQLEVIQSYAGAKLFDVTFNFNFGSLARFEPKKMMNELIAMQKVYGSERVPTLFFNSHDMSRSWERLANSDRDRYKQLAALVLINRGVAFLYQGEELGLGDYVPKEFSELRDIQAINKYQTEIRRGASQTESLFQANLVNRDRSRGLIPWSRSESGWIGYSSKNGAELDILNWYEKLLELRRKFLLKGNTFRVVEETDSLLIYQVSSLVVILNFSTGWSPWFKLSQSDCLLKNGQLKQEGTSYSLSGNGIWIGRESDD